MIEFNNIFKSFDISEQNSKTSGRSKISIQDSKSKIKFSISILQISSISILFKLFIY